MMMELPDPLSCTKFQWKKVVNEETLNKNRNGILKEVESKEYKKLDLEDMKLEKFEPKSYFTQLELNLHEDQNDQDGEDELQE